MDYWHKKWQCPFFRWDDKQIIGCEGGKLRFPDKKSTVYYADSYCAAICGWQGCTVAVSLLKHYERMEQA